MRCRNNLTHLILAGIIVLVLTPLDAQGQIAFSSDRKGNHENYEIYVMDADGGNLQNLTNNPGGDFGPAWSNSPFSVAPAGKKFTMWGRLKWVNR